MDFQSLIHKLEVGGGGRLFRLGLIPLTLLIVILFYDSGAFKNMFTQEGMDAAQLGRNLAEGKGYTTSFVRPLSIYLLKQRELENPDLMTLNPTNAAALLQAGHPDLANPPVYPVVLAGLMKVLPFRYAVNTRNPFWSIPKSRVSEEGGRQFWRYQPDFFIALFNQVLFLGIAALVFLLARRLFDARVARLSAVCVLGTELLWRFTVSGLSTMLLLLIFMGLVWCLVLMEKELREPGRGPAALLVLAGLAGVLVGVGGLTRYAFGWMILPVLAFVLLFSGRQRLILALVAFVAFAGVMTPWVVRNFLVSGTPFGTAGYAIVENTPALPEHQLERSITPDFSGVRVQTVVRKLVDNTRQIMQNDLPRLGGSWVDAFFLVGLLAGLASPAARRLRSFLLMSFGVLILVQALGRTELSEDSADINSENLLVLLAPVVLVYGASLFYQLLDQLDFRFREFRYGVIGLFGVLACLPMILVLLPPVTSLFLHQELPRGEPIAYPPYYPPAIQTVSDWMKKDELIMSDIPWAVAWYGQRQAVWLTLTAGTNFFAVNDYLKQVREVYLTRVTLDKRFLPQLTQPREQTWAKIVLETMFNKEGPTQFPLRKTQPGWLPEQFVITDRERWRKNL